MRVVFFGTPAFAVPSLDALVAEGARVEGVVTQPDRPQGRSRSRLVPSPVKSRALELGLPLLQPERPRGDVFLANLRRLAPELGVVVAYGHILRHEVLAVPRLGMINVHASLLPRHRGAAPIQAAILAGDRETGVTIMKMDEGMDTGPLLRAASTPIRAGETAGELTERLAQLGAETLIEAVTLLQHGELPPVPQDDALATLAPKLTREAARIRWDQPAGAVARQIQAYDPAPGAWTGTPDGELKLFGAVPVEAQGPPGHIVRAGPPLVIAAREGGVAVHEIQPAGRKRMPAEAWLRGRGRKPAPSFR